MSSSSWGSSGSTRKSPPALKKEGTTLHRPCDGSGAPLGGRDSRAALDLRVPGARKRRINPSAELRTKLDLYANIRPARSRLGVGLTGKPVDLVIYRENTEGFYADRNMHVGSESSCRPRTWRSRAPRHGEMLRAHRAARFRGCHGAPQKGHRVHKANVFRISDGLYLREVRKVARDFPRFSSKRSSSTPWSALLLRDPMRFDVIVAENMYWRHPLGRGVRALWRPGPRRLDQRRGRALRRTGTARLGARHRGQGQANPVSLILSAAMLLEWMAARHRNDSLAAAAKSIDAAVDATLKNPATRTADLGGRIGTRGIRRGRNGEARLSRTSSISRSAILFQLSTLKGDAMTRFISLVVAIMLAGCGLETASTAATAAALKKQELEQSKKTLEQAQQKIGQAMEQVQQSQQSREAAEK